MSYEAGSHIVTEETATLFPTQELGAALDERQLAIVGLCRQIDVPFPVEINPAYSEWWRVLHETGHWAIKDDWYKSGQYGGKKIAIETTALPESLLDAQAPPDTQVDVSYYQAAMDIIPQMPMHKDPTPGEFETRAWTALAMAKMGFENPFRTLLSEEVPGTARDTHGWHKSITAQTWAPTAMLEPSVVSTMVSLGINPLAGQFRPRPTDFRPPHEDPKTMQKLQANFDAISAHYAATLTEIALPEATEFQQQYWKTYTEWRLFTDDATPPSVYRRLLRQFDLVEGAAQETFMKKWNQHNEEAA